MSKKTTLNDTLAYTSDTEYRLTRAHDTDAGIDLFAAEDTIINPGARTVVSTGVRMKIPAGFFGKIESRSGLATKHCIDVKAGVIDSDYRGEVGVCLKNDGRMKYQVCKGDRIAQMIVQPYSPVMPVLVESLDSTVRGVQGFGSSGH